MESGVPAAIDDIDLTIPNQVLNAIDARFFVPCNKGKVGVEYA